MLEILLIGITHLDYKGPELLRKALEIERPDVLSIEGNQELIDYRFLMIPFLRENICNNQNMDWTQYENLLKGIDGYEFTVSEEYSYDRDIPLYYAETDPGLNMIRKDGFDKFLRNHNFAPKIPSRTDFESHIEDDYTNVRLMNEGMIPIEYVSRFLDNQRGNNGIGRRDEVMSRNISALAKRYDTKIVHIGGAAHTLTDPKGETIYSRLAEIYSPGTELKRKILREYE